MRMPVSRALSVRKILEHPVHGESGEDRWMVEPGKKSVVLCDGAGESWAAAAWAEALAGSLASLGPGEKAVLRARKTMSHRASTLPDWLQTPAESRGSWSTALWVQPSMSGMTVHAAAAGDTCLLILDGHRLRYSFPMKDPSDFNSTPVLIGDRGDTPAFQTRRISIAPLRRPSLVLATDALAARLLSEPTETRGELFRFLLICPQAEFASWVGKETAAGRMREDDCTLLWLR